MRPSSSLSRAAASSSVKSSASAECKIVNQWLQMTSGRFPHLGAMMRASAVASRPLFVILDSAILVEMPDEPIRG
jgi:hypothetical protein